MDRAAPPGGHARSRLYALVRGGVPNGRLRPLEKNLSGVSIWLQPARRLSETKELPFGARGEGMRKLKLQTQVSIDGYMSGPNGEMDWMTLALDDGYIRYLTDLTAPVDGIVLGRKLAEGFIPHWASNPEGEPPEFVAKMNDTKKTVFTKTLKTSPWPNVTLARGDLGEEIDALKRAPGGDLIAYGGGTFISGLIGRGLIDELHLMVNPVALGSGMRVFGGRSAFELVGASTFSCGIAILQYRPKR